MKTFFKNLLILAACYYLYFVHIFHKKRSIGKRPKILIIQLAKLGDMVCTTPMFRAIKKIYPEARITVVGNITNKDLLAGNPDIDNYITWAKNKPFSIIEDLKKEKFDFACITAPNFEALSALLLSHIPLIVVPKIESGYSPYETRSYKLLRYLVVAKPHHMHSYAPREYLRLLEPIGIFTEDTKKYLYHSPQADELVSRFINKQKLSIGISPTAGNRIKEWPAERFAKVADYLSEKYQAMIVIIAGSNEEEEVKTMLGALNAKTNIINVAGRLSIDELKALASKLYLFISADTGPIYIAEAYGVPTIDIVGPVDEREQPPIGRLHKVIVPDRKKPELFVMNARVYDVVEARRQAELATVEQVINELEGMIISGCILLKKQL